MMSEGAKRYRPYSRKIQNPSYGSASIGSRLSPMGSSHPEEKVSIMCGEKNNRRKELNPWFKAGSL